MLPSFDLPQFGIFLTTRSRGSLRLPHEMTPTKLGKPFSKLFHQAPFVVDQASEPDMKDAPAIFIGWEGNSHSRCTDLPDDPSTAAVRGDYERITPIPSLGAVRLGDGPEAPSVIGSRLI
jgi:hypothetical protein